MGQGEFGSCDGEIFFDAPGLCNFSFRNFGPKLFSAVLCVRQNYAGDFATTDQTVVPAEVMIQHEFKSLGLPGLQRMQRQASGFRFQTATAERALDASIRSENRLRAELLRAGTLDARNDAERNWFALACCVRKRLKDDGLHAAKEA